MRASYTKSNLKDKNVNLVDSMDRRANHCLAQPLPKACQRLGERQSRDHVYFEHGMPVACNSEITSTCGATTALWIASTTRFLWSVGSKAKRLIVADTHPDSSPLHQVNIPRQSRGLY